MSGTAIIVRPGTAVSTLEADALDEAMAGLRAASKAKLTRRAYTSDWNGFAAWCEGQEVEAIPADPRTVGRYLTNLSIAALPRTGTPASASTINRKAAAIASVHRTAGYDNPCAAGLVRDVLSGLRKTAGRAPNKKKALTADLLVKVVRKIKGDGRTAVRDRALLLLAFGAALRRSELVQLTVEDLEFRRRGVMVTLRRSKTDQDGEGRKIAVLDGKLHVPDAIKAWLACAGITTGRIFPATPRGNNGTDHLSENHFARIVKARCEAAGLDPEVFSGHSLRRGFATTAGDEGADLRLTANHMRHVKLETTMGYMEDGELFQNNAGKGFM